MISETRTTAPCCRREPVSQFVRDACGYSHPVGEITGVDVMTAGGMEHLSLCGHHATKLLKQLAQEAGEHPALMAIIRKKEEREERQAIASGERATLSNLARQRGFKVRS